MINVNCDRCGTRLGHTLCDPCELVTDPNMSPATHYRRAANLLTAAQEYLTDSRRDDQPERDRAAAAQACRLLTGLAYGHALLAAAPAPAATPVRDGATC